MHLAIAKPSARILHQLCCRPSDEVKESPDAQGPLVWSSALRIAPLPPSPQAKGPFPPSLQPHSCTTSISRFSTKRFFPTTDDSTPICSLCCLFSCPFLAWCRGGLQGSAGPAAGGPAARHGEGLPRVQRGAKAGGGGARSDKVVEAAKHTANVEGFSGGVQAPCRCPALYSKYRTSRGGEPGSSSGSNLLAWGEGAGGPCLHVLSPCCQ